MKKQAKKTGKFTPTEVGTLIEDLRGQFKVFGEGLNDLKEKFDTLDSKLEALTGIVNHEAKKSDLSRIDIANLKTDVADLKNTVARIEEDIRIIKNSLASITG